MRIKWPTPERLRIVWQYVYETRIAPWLSAYLFFLWWPLAWYCRRNNICFVVNIAEGTGHVLPELDNFFRQLKLGEIDPERRYVWLRTKNDFSRACVKLWGKKFFLARESTFLYDICLPLMLRAYDITHDAGTSALYWQLPAQGAASPAKPWQTYLHMGTKKEAHRLWLEYYRRRNQTSNFVPLKEFGSDLLRPDAELQDFLGGNMSRLALIHIKTNMMNATASPTDPATYLPMLHHLLDKGYYLVFVGREEIPEVFQTLPMLNYAQSCLASFEHDLQLFAVSQLSVTGGSGIAWIADVLDMPIVYLNSWHMFMPPFTKKCIYVPTLVQTKAGQFLSFREQFDLHYATGPEGGDVFPSDGYVAVNADEDDILSAVRELLAGLDGATPPTWQQQQFAHLHRGSWLRYAGSRVSDSFVKKYTHLLS